MNWADIRAKMSWEGSLRDVCVFGANTQTWEKLLEELPTWNYALRFSRDGQTARLPATFAEAASDRASSLLEVDIGGVRMNCHFFCEETIEFDLDPREVQDAGAYGRLYLFMRRLAELSGRKVVLTHENMPEAIIVAYRAGGSSSAR